MYGCKIPSTKFKKLPRLCKTKKRKEKDEKMTQTLYEEYKFYWINEFKNTPNDKPFNPALIADRFISDRSEKYINKEELKEEIRKIIDKRINIKRVGNGDERRLNNIKIEVEKEILDLLESNKSNAKALEQPLE